MRPFLKREAALLERKDDVLARKVAVAIPVAFGKRRVVCQLIFVLSCREDESQIFCIEDAVTI